MVAKQFSAAKKRSTMTARGNKKTKEVQDSESSSSDEASAVDTAGKMKPQESSSEETSDSENGGDDDFDSSNEESESDIRETGFTDENAAWLKPKQKSQLMSSSDEDEDEQDEFDDMGHEDEDDLLEVEKQSHLLDMEMEAEKEEAADELRMTIAQNTAVFHLPTAEELELDENRVVPPSDIRARVDAILEVLADFKNRREPKRARSEYVDQLASDLAELHGYLPELVEYFLSMFGPAETVEFVDASDRPRPLVVRTNTLKTRRKDLAAALMKRGVSLDPLASWSKVGLKIVESPVPIGATPEYLSGQYMLQSAASMCPVMALSPQPSEKVLDMSSAPGGKTSYLAQLMSNTGAIIANDLKPERQKATVANMHRLGVRNVITCAHDGRKMGKIFHKRFDRILLDAPCSGLGVISRDPSVKVQRTMVDIQKCGHLQKELLLAAIDALNHKSKTGGVMVYSTCSVSVTENEEVINYALSKRDIKLVDTGLDFGQPGFTRYLHKRFHPSVALTRRFYPHVHNMDGFYVAKIEKVSDRRPEVSADKSINMDGKPVDAEVADDQDMNVDSDEKPAKKRKTKGGKKRKGRQEREAEKIGTKKAKSDKLSLPPSSQKKKPRNAKVTKPRRQKVVY